METQAEASETFCLRAHPSQSVATMQDSSLMKLLRILIYDKASGQWSDRDRFQRDHEIE
jgi:hypothetical protein